MIYNIYNCLFSFVANVINFECAMAKRVRSLWNHRQDPKMRVCTEDENKTKSIISHLFNVIHQLKAILLNLLWMIRLQYVWIGSIGLLPFPFDPTKCYCMSNYLWLLLSLLFHVCSILPITSSSRASILAFRWRYLYFYSLRCTIHYTQ